MSSYSSVARVKGGTLVRRAGELTGQGFTLRDSTDVTVLLLDVTSTVKLDNVQDGRILIGPCAGAVTLRNCRRCVIAVAAKQLHLRNCEACVINCSIDEGPTLDGSSDVTFGAYNAAYPELDGQWAAAGLRPSRPTPTPIDLSSDEGRAQPGPPGVPQSPAGQRGGAAAAPHWGSLQLGGWERASTPDQPLPPAARLAAACLLDRFDADGDGAWSYQELNAYQAATGDDDRLTGRDDMASMFAAAGIPLDAEGRLRLPGLLALYQMQGARALARDIAAVGLETLCGPGTLPRWLVSEAARSFGLGDGSVDGGGAGGAAGGAGGTGTLLSAQAVAGRAIGVASMSGAGSRRGSAGSVPSSSGIDGVSGGSAAVVTVHSRRAIPIAASRVPPPPVPAPVPDRTLTQAARFAPAELASPAVAAEVAAAAPLRSPPARSAAAAATAAVGRSDAAGVSAAPVPPARTPSVWSPQPRRLPASAASARARPAADEEAVTAAAATAAHEAMRSSAPAAGAAFAAAAPFSLAPPAPPTPRTIRELLATPSVPPLTGYLLSFAARHCGVDVTQWLARHDAGRKAGGRLSGGVAAHDLARSLLALLTALDVEVPAALLGRGADEESASATHEGAAASLQLALQREAQQCAAEFPCAHLPDGAFIAYRALCASVALLNGSAVTGLFANADERLQGEAAAAAAESVPARAAPPAGEAAAATAGGLPSPPPVPSFMRSPGRRRDRMSEAPRPAGASAVQPPRGGAGRARASAASSEGSDAAVREGDGDNLPGSPTAGAARPHRLRSPGLASPGARARASRSQSQEPSGGAQGAGLSDAAVAQLRDRVLAAAAAAAAAPPSLRLPADAVLVPLPDAAPSPPPGEPPHHVGRQPLLAPQPPPLLPSGPPAPPDGLQACILGGALVPTAALRARTAAAAAQLAGQGASTARPGAARVRRAPGDSASAPLRRPSPTSSAAAGAAAEDVTGASDAADAGEGAPRLLSNAAPPAPYAGRPLESDLRREREARRLQMSAAGDVEGLAGLWLEEVAAAVQRSADAYGRLRKRLLQAQERGETVAVVQGDGLPVQEAPRASSAAGERGETDARGTRGRSLAEPKQQQGGRGRGGGVSEPPAAAAAAFMAAPTACELFASVGLRAPVPVVAVALLRLGGRVVVPDGLLQVLSATAAVSGAEGEATGGSGAGDTGGVLAEGRRRAEALLSEALSDYSRVLVPVTGLLQHLHTTRVAGLSARASSSHAWAAEKAAAQAAAQQRAELALQEALASGLIGVRLPLQRLLDSPVAPPRGAGSAAVPGSGRLRGRSAGISGPPLQLWSQWLAKMPPAASPTAAARGAKRGVAADAHPDAGLASALPPAVLRRWDSALSQWLQPSELLRLLSAFDVLPEEWLRCEAAAAAREALAGRRGARTEGPAQAAGGTSMTDAGDDRRDLDLRTDLLAEGMRSHPHHSLALFLAYTRDCLTGQWPERARGDLAAYDSSGWGGEGGAQPLPSTPAAGLLPDGFEAWLRWREVHRRVKAATLQRWAQQKASELSSRRSSLAGLAPLEAVERAVLSLAARATQEVLETRGTAIPVEVAAAAEAAKAAAAAGTPRHGGGPGSTGLSSWRPPRPTRGRQLSPQSAAAAGEAGSRNQSRSRSRSRSRSGSRSVGSGEGLGSVVEVPPQAVRATHPTRAGLELRARIARLRQGAAELPVEWSHAVAAASSGGSFGAAAGLEGSEGASPAEGSSRRSSLASGDGRASPAPAGGASWQHSSARQQAAVSRMAAVPPRAGSGGRVVSAEAVARELGPALFSLSADRRAGPGARRLLRQLHIADFSAHRGEGAGAGDDGEALALDFTADGSGATAAAVASEVGRRSEAAGRFGAWVARKEAEERARRQAARQAAEQRAAADADKRERVGAAFASWLQEAAQRYPHRSGSRGRSGSRSRGPAAAALPAWRSTLPTSPTGDTLAGPSAQGGRWADATSSTAGGNGAGHPERSASASPASPSARPTLDPSLASGPDGDGGEAAFQPEYAHDGWWLEAPLPAAPPALPAPQSAGVLSPGVGGVASSTAATPRNGRARTAGPATPALSVGSGRTAHRIASSPAPSHSRRGLRAPGSAVAPASLAHKAAPGRAPAAAAAARAAAVTGVAGSSVQGRGVHHTPAAARAVTAGDGRLVDSARKQLAGGGRGSALQQSAPGPSQRAGAATAALTAPRSALRPSTQQAREAADRRPGKEHQRAGRAPVAAASSAAAAASGGVIRRSVTGASVFQPRPATGRSERPSLRERIARSKGALSAAPMADGSGDSGFDFPVIWPQQQQQAGESDQYRDLTAMGGLDAGSSAWDGEAAAEEAGTSVDLVPVRGVGTAAVTRGAGKSGAGYRVAWSASDDDGQGDALAEHPSAGVAGDSVPGDHTDASLLAAYPEGLLTLSDPEPAGSDSRVAASDSPRGVAAVGGASQALSRHPQALSSAGAQIRHALQRLRGGEEHGDGDAAGAHTAPASEIEAADW